MVRKCRRMLTNAWISSLGFVGEFCDMERHKSSNIQNQSWWMPGRTHVGTWRISAFSLAGMEWWRAVLLPVWISRNAQICAQRWGTVESLPGESAALWTGFIWIPDNHIDKSYPIWEQVHQQERNKVQSPDQLNSSRWKLKSIACHHRSPQRISLCAGSCATDTA